MPSCQAAQGVGGAHFARGSPRAAALYSASMGSEDHVVGDNAQPSPSPNRADDKLLGEVYDQLRAIARRRLAQESPGHTLQATALVN